MQLRVREKAGCRMAAAVSKPEIVVSGNQVPQVVGILSDGWFVIRLPPASQGGVGHGLAVPQSPSGGAVALRSRGPQSCLSSLKQQMARS